MKCHLIVAAVALGAWGMAPSVAYAQSCAEAVADCDETLGVDVRVVCNPLSPESTLDLTITGTAGPYRICGDGAGGAVLNNGDAYSVAAIDTRTGACGTATGVVDCPGTDLGCPVFRLSSAPFGGTVCGERTVSAGLERVDQEGEVPPYTIQWMANGAPIPGATGLALEDHRVALEEICARSTVAIEAHVTCLVSGTTAIFVAGQLDVQTPAAPPMADVVDCGASFHATCGEELDPTTFLAAPGAKPTSIAITTTPDNAICGPATHHLAVPGCLACDTLVGSLSTENDTRFCASDDLKTFDLSSAAEAPFVRYFTTDAHGRILGEMTLFTGVVLSAREAGIFHIYAVAAEHPVTGTAVADLRAESGCFSLSLPIVVTIDDCACGGGCDDSDPCTVDTCEVGEDTCIHTPTDCADGDVCNGAESCDAVDGCLPGTPLVCDDADACNGAETCDAAQGCQAGAPLLCGDDDACNGFETCDPGEGCVTSGALACDDGNPCNGEETCDVDGGCLPGTPLDCGNGDPCDGDEACNPASGCTGGEPLACGDGDACNGEETCQINVGCQAGSALVCDDGDSCNGDEACDPLQGCLAGAPKNCDDGDACNGAETCDGNGDCQPAASPFDCDDGDACNGTETCDAVQGCVSSGGPNCDDGDPCTLDACDGATGACTMAAFDCDDGNICNGDETCLTNVGCQPGTDLGCDNSDACDGLETCDAVVGCESAPQLDCDDGNPCTLDGCSDVTGCTHALDTAGCPDAVVVDLGERLGQLIADNDIGGGCFEGDVGVNPCYDLPFCTMIGTACFDGNDQLIGVDLRADADLVGLSDTPVLVEGAWSPTGWCLSPAAPQNFDIASIPFTGVDFAVCHTDGAEGWRASVDVLTGTVQIARTVRVFTGRYNPKNWSFTADIPTLPLGPFTLLASTLHIDEGGGVGLEDVTLVGRLNVGQGARMLALDADGDYANGADVVLDLALPDGMSWTPVDHITIDALSGRLDWLHADQSATGALDIDMEIDLQPLGLLPFLGQATLDPNDTSLTGCAEATHTVDDVLGTLTLTDVQAQLCFDTDEAGDQIGEVRLGGELAWGGGTQPWAGRLQPGPDWVVEVGATNPLGFGAFALAPANFSATHDSGGPTTDVDVDGVVTTDPFGDSPLAIQVAGGWAPTGAIDLTAGLVDGAAWQPNTTMRVDDLAGSTFSRDGAGVWSFALHAGGDIDLEDLGSAAVDGDLTLTPTQLTGCLDLDPSDPGLSGTFGDVQLSGLHVSACVEPDDQGTLHNTFKVDVGHAQGGASADVAGAKVVVGGEFTPAWSLARRGAGPGSDPDLPGLDPENDLVWRLELMLPGFPIGAATLSSPRVMVDKPGGGGSPELRLAAGVDLGEGDAAVPLRIVGLYQNGGALDFDARLRDAAVWQPVDALIVDSITGNARRSDGVWSGTLNVDSVVDLGRLGSADLDGALVASNDFNTITGALNASNMADQSIAFFTLVGLGGTLNITDDGQGNRQASFDVAGQAGIDLRPLRPFDGVYHPGANWSLSVRVDTLPAGPFSFDETTFSIQNDSATDMRATSVDALVTVAQDLDPVSLRLLGTWTTSGEMELTVQPQTDGGWAPLVGAGVDVDGGTFTRSADGSWAAGIAASAEFDLGPFSDAPYELSAALDVTDEGLRVSGCFSGGTGFAEDLGGALAMASVWVEACIGQTPDGGVLLHYPFGGQVDIGNPGTDAFSGTFYPQSFLDGEGLAWRLEIDGLPLNLPALDNATLGFVAHKELAGPISVEGVIDFTLGSGDSLLALRARGAWAQEGPLDLALSLADGQSWTPFEGFTVNALSGTLSRTVDPGDADAFVWAVAVSVDTLTDLGPFGEDVHVVGDLALDTGGNVTSARLEAVDLTAFSVAGFSLTQLSAAIEAVLDDDTGELQWAATFTADVELQGQGVTPDITGTFTLGERWSLEISATDFGLGGYTLDTASFTIDHDAGPPTSNAVNLSATKDLALADAPLAITAAGAYTHHGDITLALTVDGVDGWEPAPGVVIDEFGGSFNRVADAWTLSLALAGQIDTPPFPQTDLTGAIEVDNDGEITGCLTARSNIDGPDVAVVHADVPVHTVIAGVCFDETDTGDRRTRYPIACRIDPGDGGVERDCRGLWVPNPPDLPDLDWQLELELPEMTLGDLAINRRHAPHEDMPTLRIDTWHLSATIAEDQRSEPPAGPRITVAREAAGATDVTLDGRVFVHDGVAGDDLLLDVVDGYQGESANGTPPDLTMITSQAPGSVWAPFAAAPQLTFENIDGTAERTDGLWTYHLAVDASLDTSAFGIVNATGTIDWDQSSHILQGSLTAPVPSPHIAGFVTDDLALTLDFTKAPDAELELVATLTGTIDIAGHVALDFTAVYTPGEDWTLAITVDPLLLSNSAGGTFTLSPAVVTIAHDSATDTNAITVAAMLTGIQIGGTAVPLSVTGTWSHTDGVTWTAMGSTANGSVNATFTRAAGPGSDWTFELSADVTFDLGPFGILTVSGSIKAEAEAAPTGEACATLNAPNSPMVAGVGFANPVITACYHSATQTWSLGFDADVTIDSAPHITGEFFIGDRHNWSLIASVTDFALMSNLVIPSARFVWQAGDGGHAAVQKRGSGSGTQVHLDGQIAMFGAAGTDESLELDVAGEWNDGGGMALAIAMVEGSTWSPVDAVTTKEIAGTLERTTAGGDWTATFGVAFEAYMGPQLGTHEVTGMVVIAPDGHLEACLATVSGEEVSRTVIGVTLSNLRVEACLSRADSDSPMIATFGLAGDVDIRGNDFAFDATFDWQGGGDWVLTAHLTEDLVLGNFVMQNATLTFTRTARFYEILVSADFQAGDVPLKVSGTYHSAGDFELDLSVDGTWQPFPSLELTDATGKLSYIGGNWSATIAVETQFDLGPVHDIEVGGNLTLAQSNDGVWEISGCIDTALDTAQLGILAPPGLHGDVFAEVCFGDAFEARLVIEDWEPIPFLDWEIPRIELVYKTAAESDNPDLREAGGALPEEDPAAWILEGSVQFATFQPFPALNIEDPRIIGSVDANGNFAIGMMGNLDFMFAQQQFELDDVFAGYEQVDGVSMLTFRTTHVGDFYPLQPLAFAVDAAGLPVNVDPEKVLMQDPTVAVTIVLGDNTSVSVSLCADVAVKVFNHDDLQEGQNVVTGNICGGGAFGDDTALFFLGELVPPPSGIVLPGMGGAIGAYDPDEIDIPQICIGLATGTVAVDHCVTVASGGELEQGIRLSIVGDLPFGITQDPQPVAFSIALGEDNSLSLSADIVLNWDMIEPEDNFPQVDQLRIFTVGFFLELGEGVAVGLDGDFRFWPSGQDALSGLPSAANYLDGLFLSAYDASSQAIASEKFLEGRWYHPFGLPNIAIENPGFKINIFASYIPWPTAFGYNLDAFWKKTGDWPARLADASSGAEELGDNCRDLVDNDGDGYTDCDDFDCAGCTGSDCHTHLWCADNVSTFGKTMFFQATPTPSGFCVSFFCIPLPTFIKRMELSNISMTDQVTMLNQVLAVTKEMMPDAIEDALPDIEIPMPNLDPLPLLPVLNVFQMRLSTHNKTVFGVPFRAGFRTKLDMDIGSTNVAMDGYLGPKGLSASAEITPFTLPILGTFTGDPFAHRVAVGAGYIQVNKHARLDFTDGGTIEGWLELNGFGGSPLSAKLVHKAWANKAKGYTIGVGGDLTSVCENGACVDKADVTVEFYRDSVTRRISTIGGAVALDEMTHIAVTARAQGEHVVEIFVDGLRMDVEDDWGGARSGAKAIMPAQTTQHLKIGKNAAYVDDVRMWSVARTPAEIKGQARVLVPGYFDDPTLVAVWDFNFDADPDHPLKAYNGRTYTSGKLHGAYQSGAVNEVTPGQNLFSRLSLRTDNPDETGYFMEIGRDVTIPVLAPNGVASRMRIQIGAGKVFAEAYLEEVTLLPVPLIGDFVLTGKGQNGVYDDFDDGLYGYIALSPAFEIDMDARLEFESNNPSLSDQTMGYGTFYANSTYATATAGFDLTLGFDTDALKLGPTGIMGNMAFDTRDGLELAVDGNLVAGGQSLASQAMLLTDESLTMTTEVNLPSIFGFSFSANISVSVTLNWADKTLCGSFNNSWNSGGANGGAFNCDVGVCLGATGFDLNLDCGPFDPCDGDRDCAGSEFCMLGAWCKDDFANGLPCGRPEMCQSDACGALWGTACYEPNSKGNNDPCFADDHCEAQYVCKDVLGVGICGTPFGHTGGPCSADNECAAGQGLSCYKKWASSAVKRCWKTNLAYAASCEHDNECSSGECNGSGNDKTCGCGTHSDCGDPASKVCLSDATCADLRYDDQTCDENIHCYSGNCSTNTGDDHCYSLATQDPNEACYEHDHCKSGLECRGTTRKCKCNGDNDCNQVGYSDRYCGNAGGNNSWGLCKDLKDDGVGCLVAEECRGGNCNLSPVSRKECWTDDTQQPMEECFADDHCANDRCVGNNQGATVGTCGCVLNGNDCPGNMYCKDRTGDTDRCELYAQEGDICTNSNVQCASGLSCGHRGSTTTPKRCYDPLSSEIGASCFANGQCGSGDCQWRGGQVVNGRTIAAGYFCRCNSYTDCDDPNNEWCDTWSCEPRASEGDACNPELCGANLSCDRMLLTQPRHCYDPGTALVGEICYAENHCLSGNCELTAGQYRCKCRKDNSTGETQDCGSTKYCDDFSCKARDKGLHVACGRSRECSSSYPTCDSDSWTQDKCYNANSRSIGSSCVHDPECITSGSCRAVGQKCVCTSDSHCPGQYCDYAFPINFPAVCLGVTINGNCQGIYLPAINNTYGGTGLCKDKKPDGSTAWCSRNGMCSAGTCQYGRCND